MTTKNNDHIVFYVVLDSHLWISRTQNFRSRPHKISWCNKLISLLYTIKFDEILPVRWSHMMIIYLFCILVFLWICFDVGAHLYWNCFVGCWFSQKWCFNKLTYMEFGAKSKFQNITMPRSISNQECRPFVCWSDHQMLPVLFQHIYNLRK